MNDLSRDAYAHAPKVCERCSGQGWIWFDIFGYANRRQVTCPICMGGLLVWPKGSSGLRKRIEDVKANRSDPVEEEEEDEDDGDVSVSIWDRLLAMSEGDDSVQR